MACNTLRCPTLATSPYREAGDFGAVAIRDDHIKAVARVDSAHRLFSDTAPSTR